MHYIMAKSVLNKTELCQVFFYSTLEKVLQDTRQSFDITLNCTKGK
jgi:hypothetical protein